MDSIIKVKPEIMAELCQCARTQMDSECCGLLAGRNGVITYAFPAANAASEPATNYEIAPENLFRLMRDMRTAGLELRGIYHSHPNGRNEPSACDIERAYYSDIAYFIISPQPDAAEPVRAFAISDGLATQLEIQIVP